MVAEKFVPSLKSLSSLRFEREESGMPPRILPGCPGFGGVQKVYAKKFVRIFCSVKLVGVVKTLRHSNSLLRVAVGQLLQKICF